MVEKSEVGQECPNELGSHKSSSIIIMEMISTIIIIIIIMVAPTFPVLTVCPALYLMSVLMGWPTDLKDPTRQAPFPVSPILREFRTPPKVTETISGRKI